MSGLTLCVALCCYNGEKYLPEQLRSIAGQSRPPDRVVIVDDASSDGTLEVVRAFARDAPFPVRVVENSRNVGYVRNFERGIGLAEGDVVVLSDQDDVWSPLRLARTEEAFLESPGIGLVFSDAEVVDSQLRSLGYRLWEAVGFSPAKQAEARAEGMFEVLLKGNLVTGATMAFRSELRPLVLPVWGVAGHDAWIALIASAVAGARAIPEPLIRYRQHSGNQVGVRKRGMLGRLLQARRDGVDGLVDRRVQLQCALERLQTAPVSPARLELLRAAIEHLGVRAGLPTGRLMRVPPVVQELVNGHYRRMSGGWPSAWRDLLA